MQISDCHLVQKGQLLLAEDTQTSLEIVLCEVRQSKTKIDTVVATDDLAQRPKKEICERFFRLVSKSPDIQFGFKSVKSFVFGHVLQELDSCVQGIPALGCPSTCFNFGLTRLLLLSFLRRRDVGFCV